MTEARVWVSGVGSNEGEGVCCLARVATPPWGGPELEGGYLRAGIVPANPPP